MYYNEKTRYDYQELLVSRHFVMVLLVLALHENDEKEVIRLLCIYAEMDALCMWCSVDCVHSVQILHEHYYNRR